MIDVITFENAHQYGNILPSLLRLRFRMFVERQGYEVPSLRGMEWDQFDTPAAVYLTWRDADGNPCAVARLIPTQFPYMIKELWPDLVEGESLPSDPRVWEVTRLGVDRSLPSEQRRRVIGEIVCGCLEFGLDHGIESYLLVTHPHLMKSIMFDAGCEATLLGRTRQLGRFPVAAARASVTSAILARVRKNHGISDRVLGAPREALALAA